MQGHMAVDTGIQHGPPSVDLGQLLLRPASSRQDMLDADGLRVAAYRAARMLGCGSIETLLDSYDDRPYTRTYLLRLRNDRPVATIRMSVWNGVKSEGDLPSLALYKEEIDAYAGMRSVIVEPSRFAVDPEYDLPLIAAQALTYTALLNARAHDADFLIASVRPRHELAWRKLLRLRRIDQAGRQYEDGTIDTESILMGTPAGREARARLRASNPWIRSMPRDCPGMAVGM